MKGGSKVRKGIVMELEGQKAVILTNEGAFEKISVKNSHRLTIGDEITIPSRRKIHFNKTFFSLASAAIVFLILTMSFTSNPADDVAAYVSIDINPSLEAGLNKEMEVVELNALNEDGKKIIQQMKSYDHVPIELFIDEVVNVSESSGFLRENKDVLITTTMYDDKALEMNEKLENRIENLEFKLVAREINVEALKADKEKRKKANKEGISAGRYLVYLESAQGKEVDKITLNEAKQLSISKLYKKLNKDNDVNIAENNKEKITRTEKEDNNKKPEDQKVNPQSNNENQSKEDDREERKNEKKVEIEERKQEIKQRIEEKKQEIEERKERQQEEKEAKQREKEARKKNKDDDDEDENDNDDKGKGIDINLK
jgi:hypothetical protein